MPHINDAGLALIESFEGENLRAYPDPGTGGDPWTIGYGHTNSVYPGEVITQAQALEFLKQDVANAEIAVAKCVEIVLTPNQFSALVSFEYNTGALAVSAGLPLLNQRQFEAAWDNHFCLYINEGTPAEPGLIRRRAAEKALFFTP